MLLCDAFSANIKWMFVLNLSGCTLMAVELFHSCADDLWTGYCRRVDSGIFSICFCLPSFPPQPFVLAVAWGMLQCLFLLPAFQQSSLYRDANSWQISQGPDFINNELQNLNRNARVDLLGNRINVCS